MILGLIGGVLFIVYYALRPVRLPIYHAWMILVSPIGWIISHLLLAVVYYLIITPIGLLMRLCGRDSLHRKFEADVETYWIEHRPDSDVSRYVRQF